MHCIIGVCVCVCVCVCVVGVGVCVLWVWVCVCVCACVYVCACVRLCVRKASKAFGSLFDTVLMNRIFSVTTKRNVYKAIVFSALLYGVETLMIK